MKPGPSGWKPRALPLSYAPAQACAWHTALFWPLGIQVFTPSVTTLAAWRHRTFEGICHPKLSGEVDMVNIELKIKAFLVKNILLPGIVGASYDSYMRKIARIALSAAALAPSTQCSALAWHKNALIMDLLQTFSDK